MVSIDSGKPSLVTCRQDRRQPRFFVGRGHRHCATVRARRFRADVQNIGTLLGHFGGMSDGGSGIQELAAIREGVRSDIEDAHDQRAAERKQPRKCI